MFLTSMTSPSLSSVISVTLDYSVTSRAEPSRGVHSRQPASWKKRRGRKIMHIFMKFGEKRLRGKERLSYLSTLFALYNLHFLKKFSLVTLAPLHFILQFELQACYVT